MYTRKLLFGTLFLFLFVVTGCGNIFEFLSDKESSDAKDYAVSQNLDKGEYEEVVNDPDASPLDKAAAYLGLAGLDFATIIEHMIEATEEDGDNDLQIYFDKLLPPSTLENKNYILSAINELNPEEISTDEWLIEDADVDTKRESAFLYAIALVMNAILDYKNLVDGGGQGLLNELGDSDNSGVLDAVEAGECVLEFAAVVEVDINNNFLTSSYLDTTPDTYNCQNSDVVLNIDAPIVDPPNPTAPPFTAKWIITSEINSQPISGLSFTATATVTGTLLAPIVESDIEISYGDDGIEIPLVKDFDASLKGTITLLKYALPDKQDSPLIEAMETLWDDINAADEKDCIILPPGIGTDEEDSLTSPQGSITSMEMAAYLLCNF